MQAVRLPALRGAQWLLEGYYLFRRNPPLIIFAVFSYWFLRLALDLIPLVGPALDSLCAPALAVGVMNACREVDQAGQVKLDVVFSGFGERRRDLLRLGVAYLCGTLIVLTLAAIVDDGQLLRVMRGVSEPADVSAERSRMMLAVQFALVLLIPFLMTFWFAPLLVAWDRLGALKSMFFSFVACWRNWRAFLVYALIVIVTTVLLPGVLLAFVSGGPDSTSRALVTFLFVPIALVCVPCLFASFYTSYRDVFGDRRGDHGATR